MAGQRHVPPPPDAEDRRNMRSGLWLFAVYCVAYATFMVLAAFSPATMAIRIGGRVNLAITYGFCLIIGAFALALVYLVLSRRGKTDGPARGPKA